MLLHERLERKVDKAYQEQTLQLSNDTEKRLIIMSEGPALLSKPGTTHWTPASGPTLPDKVAVPIHKAL